MKNEILSEKNFILFALNHYDKQYCLKEEEFYKDLEQIKYVKRLLTRYHEKQTIPTRLVLNHIIILYNLFGPEGSCKMLFYKIHESHWPYLKPFLLYLNLLPEQINNIKETPIWTENIPADPVIIQELKKI